jgi:hypothetical protein
MQAELCFEESTCDKNDQSIENSKLRAREKDQHGDDERESDVKTREKDTADDQMSQQSETESESSSSEAGNDKN